LLGVAHSSLTVRFIEREIAVLDAEANHWHV